ncbi:hypothetical protein QBC37DRAFT_414272 [Rhypophila decipiens]|uniref:Uncharacterized protein n=1 Tax=Rhypophila decipiens TaxID=261697 RepID=A0AAN7BE36_9PEZI|nr:hypothetical protein QBC37DRAFT_414272 [Rhypophila decipiens]
MILFETTESVIEVLWDIVLAIYVVKIAFAYFLLNFLSGLALVYLSSHHLTPVIQLTTPQSELVLVPFLLLSSIIWARFTILYYEVPRVGGFRLAAGATALVFLAGASLLVTTPILYLEGLAGWIWETDKKAGLAFGALLVAYTLMMAIQMGFEHNGETGAGEGETTTSHGHEKKSIVAAVPTVNLVKNSKVKMQ